MGFSDDGVWAFRYNNIKIMWNITVLVYHVTRDVPGWLTWPLVLTTSGGHHQNLGLERLKSLYTDCSVNLQFLGWRPPAVSAFV